MANKILTATGWQERIRAKFRVSANVLPDADIEQPDIITLAEAVITDAVPTWEDILIADDNKKVYLESAVVNYCCSLLCPSMPQRLAKIKGPLMTVDYGDTDWKEEAEKYKTDAYADIGRVNDDGEQVPIIPFGLSGPTRAGTNVV